MRGSLEKLVLLSKNKNFWSSMLLLNLVGSYAVAKSHNSSFLIVFTIGICVMITVPVVLIPIIIILDKIFPWNKESQDEYMKLASGRVDSWLLDFLIITGVVLWLLSSSFDITSFKYIPTTYIYYFFLFIIPLRFVGKRIYIELSL